MIEPKTDYGTEYASLVREQYKSSVRFAEVMKALGAQAQEIEDAFSQIESLNNAFGISQGADQAASLSGSANPQDISVDALASAPRDALNRTAVMFGIARPEAISPANLAREIKANLLVVFGRCRREDILALVETLSGFDADIQEVGDGFYISVFGALTQAIGKTLFRYLRRLAPAGFKLHGIIQGGNGYFGFQDFTDSGGFRRSGSAAAPANRMARLAVDERGKWLL